jgi:tRNA-Thr(GGU) m(6)t(6)A37 methyltransferase TsaA
MTEKGVQGGQNGIREGEIAISLPDRFDAQLGRIRTPWTRRQDCPHNAREARERGDVCMVEVDPRYQAGLKDIAGCSHLVLLYWMDDARRDLMQQMPKHVTEPRGTFALRSPVRPNPVALSVVKLLKVEGTTLSVIGVDCLDKTPLIDIKPYFASTDAVPEATVAHRPSSPNGA